MSSSLDKSKNSATTKSKNSATNMDDSFDDTSRRFMRRIQESEVREALKRMKGGKAIGPDGIPIKVWRCLGI